MKAYVEFDLHTLKDNINNLLKSCKDVMFIFPVKCCTHPSVLEIVSNKMMGFDISNRNELKVIKKYLDGQFLSVSGPLSYELLNYNYENLHLIANDLDMVKRSLSLRINFNFNDHFETSRFGVNLKECSDDILKSIEYIHFHNSDKRTKEKCQYICDEFSKIINLCPNLKYINIGGHLEDLTAEEGIAHINQIRSIIPKYIKVIVETGDFLFKNTGKLFCEVIDVKRDNSKQLVTLNFSKMANQRWVYAHYDETSKGTIDTSFYGCSCCETDSFLETKCHPLLKGERITFSNISPYAYEWNTKFNGIPKIKVIFK